MCGDGQNQNFEASPSFLQKRLRMQKMASQMSGLNSAQTYGLQKRGPTDFDESPISLLRHTPKRF